MAAYADDVLFYISNPRITIPNLLRILKQYREISNLKINLGKSEILNINISRQEEAKLQKEFHFPWRKDIKYLGIKLYFYFFLLINYIPLLDEIKKEIKKKFPHDLFPG